MTGLVEAVSQSMHSNPIFSGGIAVWIAGVITYLMRNIPKAIVEFIVWQSTTRVAIHNDSGHGEGYDYKLFLRWWSETNCRKSSRSFFIETRYSHEKGEDHKFLTAGFGKHFFIYRRRLFWFFQTSLERVATDQMTMEVIIVGLTRRKDIMDALVHEIITIDRKPNEITVYQYTGDYWQTNGSVPNYKRDWRTVVLPKATKDRIRKIVQGFDRSAIWYHKRGLAHRQTILLSGAPGGGKTSIVKGVASLLNKTIYSLDMSALTQETFSRAIYGLVSGSILLLEDIDANQNMSDRDGLMLDSKGIHKGLSLTTVLNGLDGIVPLDGVLVFITTNHIEKLDPALLRKGRVDHIFEIGLLGDTEIKEYIRVMAGKRHVPTGVTFAPIKGCDLHGLFSDNHRDYRTFVASIPRLS